MRVIDLNCDVGEGFGAYRIGADAELIPLVTSASVACGFHAGDPRTMRETVALAAAHGVAVGAHPGLPDLEGFGRREMALAPQEAYDLVLYQIGALQGFAAAADVVLQHVKPHGALYHMAARERPLADAVARAVRDLDPGLTLFGLAGGELLAAGEALGLKTASEAFADRRYRADGTLAPRGDGGVVAEPDEVVARALRMIREGLVGSVDGADVAVRVDTLCIHGDSPGAAGFARRIRDACAAGGIDVRAIGRQR